MLKKYNINVDTETDKKIFEMLDSANNKTELIKNALFYYLTQIEKGVVVDRHCCLDTPIQMQVYKKEELPPIKEEITEIEEEVDNKEKFDDDNFDALLNLIDPID